MSDDQHVRPSEPPEGAPPEDGEEPGARRRRIEGMLRETVRRALERGLEAGIGTLSLTDKVRGVVGKELPREVVGYVFSQIDETKNALVRVVAREVREFLDATDVAQELQKALTSLTFEVKTEIRFVPNDAGGVRPSVRAGTRTRKTEPPPPTHPPPADPDGTASSEDA